MTIYARHKLTGIHANVMAGLRRHWRRFYRMHMLFCGEPDEKVQMTVLSKQLYMAPCGGLIYVQLAKFPYPFGDLLATFELLIRI